MLQALSGRASARVYDVATGAEIGRVVAVDTERGEVEVTYGRDHESKRTLRYVEVRELHHGGPRGVLVFYCYGLIRRSTPRARGKEKAQAGDSGAPHRSRNGVGNGAAVPS